MVNNGYFKPFLYSKVGENHKIKPKIPEETLLKISLIMSKAGTENS